jgi:DNA-binding CsgD family transcriptional regulator
MEKRKFPAGLTDRNIELFSEDMKSPKGLYNGRVLDFHKLPEKFMNDLLDYFNQDHDAQEELKRHKINDVGRILTIFSICKFGGFDSQPDYQNGKFNPEYFDCPYRGQCRYREKLCAKIKAPNGKISRKEISVIRLIAKGLAVKQIAERLFISPETARTHVANIHRKLNVHNNAGVTAFAFRKNLTH